MKNKLPFKIRKERNKQVTEMLKDKFGIIVSEVNLNEIKKDDEWFIPLSKGKGELKLRMKE